MGRDVAGGGYRGQGLERGGGWGKVGRDVAGGGYRGQGLERGGGGVRCGGTQQEVDIEGRVWKDGRMG